MKYLLVQQWPSTKGNHAGMDHMCDLLVQLYPQEYYKIATNHVFNIPTRKYWLTRVVFGKIDRWRYTRRFLKEYIKQCHEMFVNLSEKDQVFLLEYHLFSANQFCMAKYIKKHFPKTKVIALSHLTPSFLNIIGFDEKTILEWEKAIDIQLTLGSSLSSFFKSLGIPKEKIFTGYHYVDYDYYQATMPKVSSTHLKIIVVGNLQRDFKLLTSVVEKTPFVNWIICSGHIDLTSTFACKKNVSLKGYVDEDTLKLLMNEADVSVNILEDTVGSNVITTSMAMGLAIIASDVGSIRDYCCERNAILCKNTVDAFVNAITCLSQNRLVLEQKQKESVNQSKKFHIKNIHNWFQKAASLQL